MRYRPHALLAAAALALALSGCGGSDTDAGADEPVGATGTTGAQSAESAESADGAAATELDTSGDEALPAEVAAMLQGYGVSAEDGVREAVVTLDHVAQERPLTVHGSVRTDEVIFSDGTQEVSVPIPGEHVYVSIAPYVEQTHDCHFHALGGCQGEMVEEDVSVTITDHMGQTLVEEDVTTYTNGFVGYWLPQDAHGMITITQGDLTGQAAFETGDGDATCITTLQLQG